MKVGDVMTKDVKTCFASDSTNRAAQIMWDHDCGCVPVVDHQGKLVSIVTDRDICMAAYTQGRTLAHIAVGTAASKNVVTVKEDDTLHHAAKVMRDAQVRRLPVLDAEEHFVGLLSIGDLARRIHHVGNGIPSHVAEAIMGISQRRAASTSAASSDGTASPSATATELKKELKKSLDLLQTLRDEVRVRLHLGSLDLKDQWKKLEPHLGDVEKRAEELTEASFAALTDAVKRVEKFRSSLTEHH